MRSLLLMTVMLTLFQFGSESVLFEHDIELLMDAVEEDEVILQNWEVVYLEEMDANTFANVKNELQRHHSFIIEQQDSTKKTTYSSKNKLDSIDYHITTIEQSYEANGVRMQIVIRGNMWDGEIRELFNDLTNRLQSKYTFDLKRNFTCIKLLNNGIISDGFSVNNLMENMQVVNKMNFTDNMESSVYEEMHYGYSTLLSNELDVDETQVNLHVVMRKIANDKKQIIIGTPGILNEY